MTQPETACVTFQGTPIYLDSLPTTPGSIFVAPWVLKKIKAQNRAFSRRDRRRKHKRHATSLHQVKTTPV